MAPYTKAKREELTDRAVELSSRGWTALKIAGEIGVTDKTIRKWMGDELSRRAEHRDQDRERAIARYEAVIAAAWERYDRMHDASLNTSGLLNTIRTTQQAIDDLTGVKAPIKVQDTTEDYEVVWDDADDADTG